MIVSHQKVLTTTNNLIGKKAKDIIVVGGALELVQNGLKCEVEELIINENNHLALLILTENIPDKMKIIPLSSKAEPSGGGTKATVLGYYMQVSIKFLYLYFFIIIFIYFNIYFNIQCFIIIYR